MTIDDLDKQDACKYLLESPAPIVVGRLIDELRKYFAFVDSLKSNAKIHPIDEDALTELIEKHLI